MIIGVLIVAICLLALLFFFNGYQNKYQSFQGRVYNIVIISLLLFIVFSVGYVYVTSGIGIDSLQSLMAFVKVYFSWFIDIFSKVKGTVGYAIKQEWSVNATSVLK